MNAVDTLELARKGELYPGVILHGASDPERRRVAIELARTLLCAAAPEARPCGTCSHCRRIPLPPAEGREDRKARPDHQPFHPDLQLLERDLKTSTSVDATKEFLKSAQVSPFEARGQVFIVANAETLTGEAANALLKTLEEPHISAPRHFLLLAPSQLDLLRTVRSRSLAVYLGPAEGLSDEDVADLIEELAGCLAGWARTGSVAWLLAASAAIDQAGDWSDPRAGQPWAQAAHALIRAREKAGADAALSRAVLAAAEDLLRAPALRLRGIPQGRILDGTLARHLGAARGANPTGPDR